MGGSGTLVVQRDGAPLQLSHLGAFLAQQRYVTEVDNRRIDGHVVAKAPAVRCQTHGVAPRRLDLKPLQVERRHGNGLVSHSELLGATNGNITLFRRARENSIVRSVDRGLRERRATLALVQHSELLGHHFVGDYVTKIDLLA